jgi:hypothetical protein
VIFCIFQIQKLHIKGTCADPKLHKSSTKKFAKHMKYQTRWFKQKRLRYCRRTISTSNKNLGKHRQNLNFNIFSITVSARSKQKAVYTSLKRSWFMFVQGNFTYCDQYFFQIFQCLISKLICVYFQICMWMTLECKASGSTA